MNVTPLPALTYLVQGPPDSLAQQLDLQALASTAQWYIKVHSVSVIAPPPGRIPVARLSCDNVNHLVQKEGLYLVEPRTLLVTRGVFDFQSDSPFFAINSLKSTINFKLDALRAEEAAILANATVTVHFSLYK